MSEIDLPQYEKNTEIARQKMIQKAKEKGNTWRMAPNDPFLYNAMDAHLMKLQMFAKASDREGIIRAAADIINYANMIMDNARYWNTNIIDLSDKTLGTPGANR